VNTNNTNVFLIRHAQAKNPISPEGQKLVYGDMARITREGHEQMIALSNRFNENGMSLDTVYYSPAYRATQSAAEFVLSLSPNLRPTTFVPDEGLRPSYIPQWIGQPEDDVGDIFEKNPKKEGDYGENPDQVKARVLKAFQAILRDNPGKNIGIVVHDDIIALLWSQLVFDDAETNIKELFQIKKGEGVKLIIRENGNVTSHEILKPLYSSSIEAK